MDVCQPKHERDYFRPGHVKCLESPYLLGQELLFRRRGAVMGLERRGGGGVPSPQKNALFMQTHTQLPLLRPDDTHLPPGPPPKTPPTRPENPPPRSPPTPPPSSPPASSSTSPIKKPTSVVPRPHQPRLSPACLHANPPRHHPPVPHIHTTSPFPPTSALSPSSPPLASSALNANAGPPAHPQLQRPAARCGFCNCRPPPPQRIEGARVLMEMALEKSHDGVDGAEGRRWRGSVGLGGGVFLGRYVALAFERVAVESDAGVCDCAFGGQVARVFGTCFLGGLRGRFVERGGFGRRHPSAHLVAWALGSGVGGVVGYGEYHARCWEVACDLGGDGEAVHGLCRWGGVDGGSGWADWLTEGLIGGWVAVFTKLMKTRLDGEGSMLSARPGWRVILATNHQPETVIMLASTKRALLYEVDVDPVSEKSTPWP